MKINITKKEYRLLLEALYLSDWMMHAFSISKDQYHSEHEALKEKLLSYSKEMGSEDIIQYSNKLNRYFETSEFDSYMHDKFIDPYDDEMFWDELIDRLAVRDVINEIGIEKYSAMDGFEKGEMLDKVKERYANEFMQTNLDNIKVEFSNSAKNLT